jgi:hypothetical protein
MPVTADQRQVDHSPVSPLVVTPAGDRYEQEAERLAKQTVELLQSSASAQAGQELRGPRKQESAPQRPGLAGPARERLRGSIQRVSQPPAGGGLSVAPNVAAQIQHARGDGQPLPEHVRARMEQALGADFSAVRIHTGAGAHSLNRSLQARAFTIGQDIFFGRGEYNPASASGQEIIAHELVHSRHQEQGADVIQLARLVHIAWDAPAIRVPATVPDADVQKWNYAHQTVRQVEIERPESWSAPTKQVVRDPAYDTDYKSLGYTTKTSGKVLEIADFDIRHEIAWDMLSKFIRQGLAGKTPQECQQWLQYQEVECADTAQSTIERAADGLAKRLYEDTGNLWYGEGELNQEIGRVFPHVRNLIKSVWRSSNPIYTVNPGEKIKWLPELGKDPASMGSPKNITITGGGTYTLWQTSSSSKDSVMITDVAGTPILKAGALLHDTATGQIFQVSRKFDPEAYNQLASGKGGERTTLRTALAKAGGLIGPSASALYTPVAKPQELKLTDKPSSVGEYSTPEAIYYSGKVTSGKKKAQDTYYKRYRALEEMQVDFFRTLYDPQPKTQPVRAKRAKIETPSVDITDRVKFEKDLEKHKINEPARKELKRAREEVEKINAKSKKTKNDLNELAQKQQDYTEQFQSQVRAIAPIPRQHIQRVLVPLPAPLKKHFRRKKKDRSLFLKNALGRKPGKYSSPSVLTKAGLK